jgi:CBS-domain-containing membrane protein
MEATMQRTVQDVMTRDVVTAHTTTPYKELVRLLAEHRIAALPIVDDAGHTVGIVSETDLTAQQGAELHPDAHVTAAYVMATPVVTAHPEMPITEAARLMRDRKVKRLPVADAAGTLAGIVARADLLKVFLRPDDEIRFEIIDRAIHDLPGLDVADLRIEARDGEVTLAGRVQTKRQAIRLRELADEAEGVIAVHDRLAFDLDDSREPAPMD